MGTKLNKPAVVVLERIFPPAGVRPYVFARELEKSLESAVIVGYILSKATWVMALFYRTRFASEGVFRPYSRREDVTAKVMDGAAHKYLSKPTSVLASMCQSHSTSI